MNVRNAFKVNNKDTRNRSTEVNVVFFWNFEHVIAYLVFIYTYPGVKTIFKV